MYEAYWNLSKKPFRNDLDLSFAYMWEGYEEALARMDYWAADGKRFALLTGPAGVGKSYLLALLSRDIRRRGDVVSVMPNPSLAPLEFLQYVLTLYGHDEPCLSKSDALSALSRFAMENAAQNTRTYLLVDEGQAVRDPRTLEEINLILNLTYGSQPLFSVVMAGEPSLRDVLAGCQGLRQKVEIGAELPLLTLEETAGYISSRLQAAGSGGDIFAGEAIERLHAWAKGVPRLINTAADFALLAAFGEEKRVVDVAAVESGLEDIKSQVAAA